MAKRTEPKIAKYEIGDILKYINPISKDESIVILLRRYDKEPYHRVAWWYKDYPNGVEEHGAPEEEFSRIDLI